MPSALFSSPPDTLSTLQGVDYLGMGYDMIHGNPEGDEKTMLDDGFRQPVRKTSYTGVSLTRDNRYLTPDGSFSVPLRSCYKSEVMSDTSTESAYQNSLAIDVSVKGSIKAGVQGAAQKEGSFSASVGYRKQEAVARANSESKFESKSYCSKYRGAPRAPPHAPPLAPAHNQRAHSAHAAPVGRRAARNIIEPLLVSSYVAVAVSMPSVGWLQGPTEPQDLTSQFALAGREAIWAMSEVLEASGGLAPADMTTEQLMDTTTGVKQAMRKAQYAFFEIFRKCVAHPTPTLCLRRRNPLPARRTPLVHASVHIGRKATTRTIRWSVCAQLWHALCRRADSRRKGDDVTLHVQVRVQQRAQHEARRERGRLSVHQVRLQGRLRGGERGCEHRAGLAICAGALERALDDDRHGWPAARHRRGHGRRFRRVGRVGQPQPDADQVCDGPAIRSLGGDRLPALSAAEAATASQAAAAAVSALRHH